ncbi:hypothetical protein BJ508DRAFT_411126 [Ascobolus immersus RN42]|uniref:TUG ubiquitin-like domain-containing protein n=1 Tax=Ascobolus immersus RN42 TaxID=1160509 RepID=A0A3N4IQB9_ASCIM|nr:hypothetical protein BJ508DRAFT_411126 [Ascobolus immersus RN42]
MATFVLVEDDRPGIQYKINVTPSTQLTDVLKAACEKLKVPFDGRGLKRNGKPLDLSLSFRLAGIPQGSKLLVYRLPSSANSAPILVGVQVPGEKRIPLKFPTSTSLWSILKAAEAELGKPGSITERAEPQLTSGKNDGTGRLFYIRPVVRLVTREIKDLEELKLSLKQLGVAKGPVLLNVSFETTAIALEEALEQIHSVLPEENVKVATPVETTSTTTPSEGKTKEGTLIDFGTEEATKKEDDVPMEEAPAESEDSGAVEFGGITIFRPPTNVTPQAASTEYNEEDYKVGIDEVKVHQANLEKARVGQRLPSDKEIETKRQEQIEKSKRRKQVRVRFPEDWKVEKNFEGTETAVDLYEAVKSVLRHPEQDFSLFLPPPFPQRIPRNKFSLATNLGASRAILLTFQWGDAVPEEVKKAPALSDAAIKRAVDLVVPQEVKAEPEPEVKKVDEGKKKPANGGGKKDGPRSLPSWMVLGRK